MTIAAALHQRVRAHKLGVVWVEGGVITHRDPDSVRGPDVAFSPFEDFPGGKAPRRGYVRSGRLVVEVLPPSDRLSEALAKGREYLDAGTVLVWIVEPDRRAAYVLRDGRPQQILTGDEALDGEDVVPGFSLPLPDVWEGLADDVPS